MRTLKKTLSLILALALCLSLGSVALAAPLDDYTDKGSVGATYYQAVETLVGLGVIEGPGDGTLIPTKTYTREEAAKVVTYLMLGPTAAAVIGSTAVKEKPFSDVATDRWSAGYIAYCAKQGILDGIGGGKFDPTGTLTGYQWAKMLLCALGYGEKDEYVGEDWAINVAKDSIPLGIFADDLSGAGNKTITRQQAILYAFNTLWLNRVALNKDTNKYIMDDDDGLGGGAGEGYGYLDEIDGSNTETFDGQLVSGVGYYGTLAWNIYGIAWIHYAVVRANEEADLGPNGWDALPDGLTRFHSDEFYYNYATLLWSSGLDDLGESREVIYGVANGIVYSCVDTGLNVVAEYENGESYLTNTWDGYTEKYVNYDSASLPAGGKVLLGDYMKVIDNEASGHPDVVLYVHYTQAIITEIKTNADGSKTTITTAGSFAYKTGDVVNGVVNLFEADGNYWVYNAAAVKATAVQKDFANGTLKLSDNKSYKWSEITNATGYNGSFANVDDGIEYIFYLDTYGNIRSYRYPGVDVSDYILLTELYNKTSVTPGTNESGALISDGATSATGAIVETVTTAGAAAEYKAAFYARYDKNGNGKVDDLQETKIEFDLTSASHTDYVNYLRGAFGSYGIPEVRYAWTNLAAYSLSSGTASLSIAEEFTQKVDTGTYPDANQYVGLVRLSTGAIAADQKHFDYDATDFNELSGMSNNEYVNINDNTVVYFVIDDDQTNAGVDKVYTKVGYDSIPAINGTLMGVDQDPIDASDIHAVYALCDNVNLGVGGYYFVGSILVIEMTQDPFITEKISEEVIFSLSNVTKTAGATAEYDFIEPNGTVVENARLNADFYDGQDSFLAPVTWYVRITTTTTSPTGTKVEVKVDPNLYYIPSSDLPGVYFGTIFRTNDLVSYMDIYPCNLTESTTIPLAPTFKVYKFVETVTVIDSVPYYTYSLVELTSSDVLPGDRVGYYTNAAGQIVYMIDFSKSTGVNPALYGNPLTLPTP